MSYKDHWFIRDHLGSVRTVVDITSFSTSFQDVVIEQNDYLPFGTRVAVKSAPSNLYRYNGKEEQQIAGTNLAVLDYGTRTYDPWLSRWTSIDPLAAKYYSTSPYVFCNNSPVNFVDLDGKRFTKSIRGNKIIISATYYTDYKSKKSAIQAITFWNNRKDDYFISEDGKKYRIFYRLSIIEGRTPGKLDNLYYINDEQVPKYATGGTRHKMKVFVKEAYSLFLPNTDKISTTGAHEIGHTLGMTHTDTGIMSESQNEYRTDEVQQENLRQML